MEPDEQTEADEQTTPLVSRQAAFDRFMKRQAIRDQWMRQQSENPPDPPSENEATEPDAMPVPTISRREVVEEVERLQAIKREWARQYSDWGSQLSNEKLAELSAEMGDVASGTWAAVVRWMAAHASEGYTLAFSVEKSASINGVRYVARMTTPEHSELGLTYGANSLSAALGILYNELRDYEAML